MNYRVKIGKHIFYITDHETQAEELKDLKISPSMKAELNDLLNLDGEHLEGGIDWGTFVDMFNAAAARNDWPQITSKNKDIKTRFLTAKKSFQLIEDWELIIKTMEDDEFYSGKSGIYKRPCALTLFRDGRYATFYEDGIHMRGKPRKQSLDDLIAEVMK